MFKQSLLSLIVLSLTGCSTLSVRTEYFSHQNLASYYVGTPDPLLDNPPLGQRLIVYWSIPKRVKDLNGVTLEVSILLRNKEQIREEVPLCKKTGLYMLTIANERFIETGGIQTYKIEIWQGDELIEEWRHQLWVELITFDKKAEFESDSVGESFDLDDDEED